VKAGTVAALNLTDNSQIYKDNPAGTLTVRITVTYTDQTDATAQRNLKFGSNGKIDCPA
jgi:hypothetical protein